VVRWVLGSARGSLHPVTRYVVMSGAGGSPADVFSKFYALEELRRIADLTFREIDALALPTAPTLYTIDELAADPIQLNSRLGVYTNFTNLLNLCALAVPAALTAAREPYGITLLAPAGRDAMLATIGRVFHANSKLPLGALDVRQPPLAAVAERARAGEVIVAVVGAHLSGMPLNGELCRLDARLIEATATTADYRLFELAGTQPPKPGLLRVAGGAGQAIDVELWAMSAEAFGRFVADVPPPLSIGTLALKGGGSAKGFLVEAEAVAGARDISSFGGWRQFAASIQAGR
jgi:allophanate hydrolase